MRHHFVRSENEVDAVREDGDTARVRTTLDAGLLEQRVIEFAPGRSRERGTSGREELLFVLAGRGTLHVDGREHALEPDTAAYLRGGDRTRSRTRARTTSSWWRFRRRAAVNGNETAAGRRVTIRFADQPEHRADSKRTFRYLVNQDVGCETVTQFLGVVEPCRAPDHSHATTRSATSSKETATRTSTASDCRSSQGSCFHLPPEQVHCIENTGPGVMRILGVFHPSGDPASRSVRRRRALHILRPVRL